MPDEASWNRGAARVVRPYAVTGGRTQPDRTDLELEALVATTPDAPLGGTLTYERRRIALLCREMHSIVEISARLEIPLGVVRVLVADMVTDSLVEVHRPAAASHRPDLALLQRVLDGLRAV